MRENAIMRLPLILLLAATAFAQVKLANPGFEQGVPGSVPTGWIFPPVVADAGFGVKLVEEGCRTGARCAMLTGVAEPLPNKFGNLLQSLPAGGYAWRHIRLRAAIRVAGPN